ncbi:hypothetical protein F66182_1912 [Fusarium sp. NRRL 66182]|nr:hypothetical protein F66182_1912 [Fusarium sp. NRRL 66182]
MSNNQASASQTNFVRFSTRLERNFAAGFDWAFGVPRQESGSQPQRQDNRHGLHHSASGSLLSLPPLDESDIAPPPPYDMSLQSPPPYTPRLPPPSYEESEENADSTSDSSQDSGEDESLEESSVAGGKTTTIVEGHLGTNYGEILRAAIHPAAQALVATSSGVTVCINVRCWSLNLENEKKAKTRKQR